MPAKKVKEEVLTRYEKNCKICNSYFKNAIEEMYNRGLNAKQIYEALFLSQNSQELQILQQEAFTEAHIKRHLEKHYNEKASTYIRSTTNKAKLKKAREDYKKGQQIKIDTIQTISHLIDVALIKMESLDDFPDGRQAHQLTINYMSIIKNLIDEFSKLTGELKVENTIDINFWNVQITEFANIVIKTIRKMDDKFKLNNALAYEFGKEFQIQWTEYKNIQKQIFNGELPINYGEKERSINTFNMDDSLKNSPSQLNETDNIKKEQEELQYIEQVNKSYNEAKQKQELNESYYNTYHTDNIAEQNTVIDVISEDEYNNTVINQKQLNNTEEFINEGTKIINNLNNEVNELQKLDRKSAIKNLINNIKKDQ